MLTYYEDEINRSIFAKNGCENYIELMEKFLIEGKYFTQKGDKDYPPYKDPDNCLKNCSYFWELTQFLNKREEKYKMYKYIAPNKCQKAGQEENQYPGSNANEIIVCDYAGKEKFRLKSDQFGFLIGNSKKDFDSHSYGYLCSLLKEEAEEEKKRTYRVIAECIYRTRTLGGGFLWEKGIWGGYNPARGKSYREDRVDLTLLEIKHLYEWIELGMPKEDAQDKDAAALFNKIANGTKNNRFDALYYIIKNKKQKEEKGALNYIEWLQHFGTFENFIQFFCFDDFVDSKNKTWMPLDIMESKLDYESESLSWEKAVFLKDPTEYKTKYKKHGKYSIYYPNRYAEELKQMLINVSSLTLARSYRMQEVINGISN